MSQLDIPPGKDEERDTRLRKAWVPAVLVIGLLFGEIISYFSTTAPSQGERGGGGGPGDFDQFPHFSSGLPIQLDIVLTTVEMALLVSLLVVYARTYAQTKASFSLGLVVVLFALLLQSLFSYPLLIELMGTVSLGPGYSNALADVFMVCACAVFLYLSLE